MKKLILPLAIISGIASCQKSDCKDAVEAKFVDKTGLDGCGIVIEISDNEYLEPTNLDGFAISPEDGMKIWVSYNLDESSSSVCMIGDLVEIECVEERE